MNVFVCIYNTIYIITHHANQLDVCSRMVRTLDQLDAIGTCTDGKGLLCAAVELYENYVCPLFYTQQWERIVYDLVSQLLL